jgi:AcrR family transcriptional regulator
VTSLSGVYSRYKGRRPAARTKTKEIEALAADGLSNAAIAARLGISKRSVFRVFEPARS